MRTSQISSGSKLFLEQIKSYFNIERNIRNQVSDFYDHVKNRKVKASVYILSLGPGLFNEMLINFPDSLKRKRITKYTLKQKLKKANRARLSKK